MSLNVNPNTVVAAYKHLESEGIAETRRGLGTFVKEEVSIEQLKTKVLKEFAESYLKEFVGIGVDLEKGIAILKEVYDEHQGE